MSESSRRRSSHTPDNRGPTRSSPRVDEAKKVRRSSSAASNGSTKLRRSSSANRATSKTPQRKMTSMDIRPAAPPTDRIGMLVVEANEISLCLQKPYVFKREDESCTSEEQTRIRVTNTKYHICTTWSCAKLKERLGRMRRLMYSAESETSGIGGESVFFDPDDAWVKVTSENGELSNGRVTNGHVDKENHQSDVVRRRKGGERSERPRPVRPISMPVDLPVNGLSRGSSLFNSTELPAESEFLKVTTSPGEVDDAAPSYGKEHGTRMSPLTSVLPDRPISVNGTHRDDEIPNYHHRPTGTVTPIRDVNSSLLDRHSPLKKSSSSLSSSSRTTTPSRRKVITHHACTQTDQPPESAKTLSVLTLCKEMVTMTLTRSKGVGSADSLVDRILCSCECAKVAVVNILEAYTQALENSTHDDASFQSSNLVGVSSFQLVTTLELLVSHTTLWVASSKGDESSVGHQLCANITSTVQELTDELVTFLQGCESDVDNIAQESASKIIEFLFDLVKFCGELALANDILPGVLKDAEQETLEDLISMSKKKDNDIVRMLPGVDLKQAFSTGSDLFLDTTLQEALSTLEECEESVQSLAELCTTELQIHKDILKHVYIVMATSKLLVFKCQQIQEDVSSDLKAEESKPRDYFYHYFQRAICIISQVNHLVDNITLLNEASVPFGAEPEEEHGNLRKLCRCVEMVQRATGKLLLAFKMDAKMDSSCETSSQHSHSSNSRLSVDFGVDHISFVPTPQLKELEAASQDSEQAIYALVEIIRRQLPKAASDIGAKVKRMLPATPGRALVRCNSARTTEASPLTHVRSSLHGMGISLDL